MSILGGKLQVADEEKHKIQHCIISYSVMNATDPLNHNLCIIYAQNRQKMNVSHCAFFFWLNTFH